MYYMIYRNYLHDGYEQENDLTQETTWNEAKRKEYKQNQIKR